MSISYAPGTAYALVRPGVVVLLDGSVAAASVSSVWASLERLGRPETSMADVLDAVTTVLDPSLRELPDFAIVLHEASAGGEETGVLHVVARGTVSVHLAGEVGSETIEAFDMTTWADKRFTDVDHYEVAAGPTGLPAELSLALGTGVVTARSVSWQRPAEVASAGDTAVPAVPVDAGDDSPGTEVPAPQAVVAPVEPVAEPDLAMVPVHPVEPDFARTLGEFPDGALDDVALEDAGLEGASLDDDSRDGAPSDHDLAATGASPADESAADQRAAGEEPADEVLAAVDPVGASTPAEEPVPDDATVDGTADALAAAGDSAPDPEEQVHDETGDGEDVEDDTVLSIDGLRSFMKDRDGAASATDEPTDVAAQPVRPALPPVPPPPPAPPVEQEAPAAQQPQPVQHAPVGTSGSPYPVYQAAPQTPPGEAYAPAPQLQGAPSPSSAPYPAPQPAPPYQPSPLDPPAPSSEPAEAHEPAPASAHGGPPSGQQWTVQLPGTPVAPVAVVGPAPVPAADVPTILARSCAYGHANTPVRSTCAVCGGGLNPQAEVVPRPSLGRVVLSTGDVVELEQPVVFGRYPQAHVVTAQAQAPRLVTVPSPSQDISRSHLEVRLEGWNVLLVDLTTVNGTTLLRPGQPPRRLHPQEPTLVVSGDVADLGDGVRLTFEGVA